MKVMNGSCLFRCNEDIKRKCIDVLDGRSLSHFFRQKMIEEINKTEKGLKLDEHRQTRI